MINQDSVSYREKCTSLLDYKTLPFVLPGALVRGGKIRGVEGVWLTWSLYLNDAKAAAKHKATTRKTERAMTAIMPLLSPPLCCLFDMSTPRGFIVLPLLPPPEYGPPSIMEMLEGGKGGDGGKPILRGTT